MDEQLFKERLEHLRIAYNAGVTLSTSDLFFVNRMLQEIEWERDVITDQRVSRLERIYDKVRGHDCLKGIV